LMVISSAAWERLAPLTRSCSRRPRCSPPSTTAPHGPRPSPPRRKRPRRWAWSSSRTSISMRSEPPPDPSSRASRRSIPRSRTSSPSSTPSPRRPHEPQSPSRCRTRSSPRVSSRPRRTAADASRAGRRPAVVRRRPARADDRPGALPGLHPLRAGHAGGLHRGAGALRADLGLLHRRHLRLPPARAHGAHTGRRPPAGRSQARTAPGHRRARPRLGGARARRGRSDAGLGLAGERLGPAGDLPRPGLPDLTDRRRRHRAVAGPEHHRGPPLSLHPLHDRTEGGRVMEPLLAAVVLFGTFAVLLALSVPISVGIIISAFATALVLLPWSGTTYVIGQQMNMGVESFSLLAVPLFILAGNIMNNGGIAQRLVDLALVIAGRVPGSLAHTNVLANMLFGSLSGSAVASAAAIGGTLHERQRKAGYDPAFSTSVNIASASVGLLIPPTTAAIVYSTVAGGVSVAALFMAGYVPGILMGLVVMAIAFVVARRRGYRSDRRVSPAEAARTFGRAVPSLLLVVVAVGGIVAGVFTATEGAAVAVLYCLVLSFIYRSLDVAALKQIAMRTVSATGVVMLLIAASSAMAW